MRTGTLGSVTNTPLLEDNAMPFASISKWEPNGGRGQVIVGFSEIPPEHVIKSLRRVLDGQGMEVQAGRTFKFWTTNSHVSDTKIENAEMALHRSGYQRFDHRFMDAENAAECWGCDDPENPNYLG